MAPAPAWPGLISSRLLLGLGAEMLLLFSEAGPGPGTVSTHCAHSYSSCWHLLWAPASSHPGPWPTLRGGGGGCRTSPAAVGWEPWGAQQPPRPCCVHASCSTRLARPHMHGPELASLCLVGRVTWSKTGIHCPPSQDATSCGQDRGDGLLHSERSRLLPCLLLHCKSQSRLTDLRLENEALRLLLPFF